MKITDLYDVHVLFLRQRQVPIAALLGLRR